MSSAFSIALGEHILSNKVGSIFLDRTIPKLNFILASIQEGIIIP